MTGPRADSASPLVVTLAIDEAAQHRFDAERRRYFPPERLLVGAHVTLFHAVPGDLRAQVDVDLRSAAATPAFELRVDEVVSLGRGTAYRLRSAELACVHRTLQRTWWSHLTAQDRQPLRAHVTVQNKVTPWQARHTTTLLRAVFEPFDVPAEGLALWRYDKGRWVFLERYDFHDTAAG